VQRVISGLKAAFRQHFNYTIRTRALGADIRIPVQAGIGRAHLEEHESHITELFSAVVHAYPDLIYLDVGANIGQTLLKLFCIAGADVKYFGFEPNPAAASYLNRFIYENQMTRAQVLSIALGTNVGIEGLGLESLNSPDPGASMNPSIRDKRPTTECLIPVMPGDVVLAHLGLDMTNCFLKIDVEGFELQVLEGMRSQLQKHSPLIVLELLRPKAGFSEDTNRYRERRNQQITSYLSDLGFTGSRLAETDDYVFAKSGSWERATNLPICESVESMAADMESD